MQPVQQPNVHKPCYKRVPKVITHAALCGLSWKAYRKNLASKQCLLLLKMMPKPLFEKTKQKRKHAMSRKLHTFFWQLQEPWGLNFTTTTLHTNTHTNLHHGSAQKRTWPTAQYNQLYWARDQRAREIVQRAKQCMLAALPREQGALRIGLQTTEHFSAVYRRPEATAWCDNRNCAPCRSIRQHWKMNRMGTWK